MNIEHAKTIPLRTILSKIEFEPMLEIGATLTYLSPLHDEGKPSFKVNTAENTWVDCLLDMEGGPLEFVCMYLQRSGESHTLSDGLRWLNNMVGYKSPFSHLILPDYSKEDRKYTVRGVESLEDTTLANYLAGRAIPIGIARQFLKEVRVSNKSARRRFDALGIRNEDGGYAIRSPFIKANTGSLSITFIRGEEPRHAVHIFKDIMDFLSVIAIRKGKLLEDDAIILNAPICMNASAAYIRNYDYRTAYTWLDNSDLGQQATKAYAVLFENEGIRHVPKNPLYVHRHDVNSWLMAYRHILIPA